MVTETEPAPAKLPFGGATPRGRGTRRFTLGTDIITTATADLPDADRVALRWIAQYGRAKNLSIPDLAAQLRKPDGGAYSRDSLYHALTGGRKPEQLANIISAIEKFRAVEEGRAQQAKTGYIETNISRAIWAGCRKAFLRAKVYFIFGESQIGKTTALEEYARQHNHGETIYVRMPTGGGLGGLVQEMAGILDLPIGNNMADLQRRIIAAFDSRMLLIIDEAHEAMSEHYSSKRGVRTLNFLREIHDRAKCGVVFSATNVLRDGILRGPHAKNLRQLWLRGMAPLQLPDRPGEADLDTFAQAYGLSPAPDEELGVRVKFIDTRGEPQETVLQHNVLSLQGAVIREFGLGRWNTILAEASDTAAAQSRPLTWPIVLHAWHSFEQAGQEVAA